MLRKVDFVHDCFCYSENFLVLIRFEKIDAALFMQAEQIECL